MANETGQIIKSLPIEYMVAQPLIAAIKAHVMAAQAYADFFKSACLYEDGGVRMIRLKYAEQETDDEGNATGKHVERVVDVPFFAMIAMPSFGMDKVNVDFELEISAVKASKQATDASIEASAKFGFGPWGASVKGKVSHHRESTRKTDTRAKYSFHVEASRQAPPEALMRVIDHVLNGTSHPVDSDKAPKLNGGKGGGKKAA
jgi:hypothetical protein